MASSVTDAKLLWRDSESKICFQTYRLWPTFIGYRTNDRSAGVLPMMLWPEQTQLLVENGAPILQDGKSVEESDNTNISSNMSNKSGGKDQSIRKRNRDDMEKSEGDSMTLSHGREAHGNELENEEENTSTATKKRKIASSSSLLRSASDAIANVFKKSWSWMRESMISSSAIFGSIVSTQSHPSQASTMTSLEMKTTIFRDLQKRHYFVGPADVYGGDYNIYKGGDPSNSHSAATIRIVRQRKITARDLLCFSRVQNQVAKSAILAFVHPDTSKPEYLIVNFRNVSDRL